MADLEEETGWKEAFVQYKDAATTVVNYSHKDGETLELYDKEHDTHAHANPPADPWSESVHLATNETWGKEIFSDPRRGYIDEAGVVRTATGRRRAIQPTTFGPTASLMTTIESSAQPLGKQDEDSVRLRVLQSFLQTPIQRPKLQPFAIAKYDYSNTRWPSERPLDRIIIRMEARYDEVADIARNTKMTGRSSEFAGIKDSNPSFPDRADQARTLLNSHAFAMSYKFQPIAAAVWMVYLEGMEKDSEDQVFAFHKKL
ncbi:hypothetical protein FKW77_006531 [Venturia effusa]|uniref:Uncharacterized protein n=1 Tax=Venturia effusa TaxID=50376 RepID=A0A517LKF1_9PEZI|nr:hypothetical protein FKW77_006531 [Venturia effusa]